MTPSLPILPNLKLAVPFFMVKDMKKSLEFYVNGLGFEVKFDWKPAGRIEWCWVDRDGVAFMLQEYHQDRVPMETPGVGVSVCIVCEDSLMLYDEFLRKGLTPVEPFVGNNMWVVGLQDPDGYVLNFESTTDVKEETRYSEWKKFPGRLNGPN